MGVSDVRTKPRVTRNKARENKMNTCGTFLMLVIKVCLLIFFSEVVIDEAQVAQLVEMGFALEGCRKAVYHTRNQGIELAINWVMEHLGDPGIYW